MAQMASPVTNAWRVFPQQRHPPILSPPHTMSLPRLSFLYPSLCFSKRVLYPAAAARRHRHGTAVEPTASPELKAEPVIGVVEDKPPPPPPPPPPSPPPTSPLLPPQTAVLNLTPGEWVHHFDTYGLAKNLEGSGFKNGQAVTIMKGIRGLLTQNLEIAKESLVSKSNVENVCFHPSPVSLPERQLTGSEHRSRTYSMRRAASCGTRYSTHAKHTLTTCARTAPQYSKSTIY